MLECIFCMLIADQQYTSPRLLIEGNPEACVTIRIIFHSLLGRKYFYLICISLPVIFHLHGGQEVTSFFVGQEIIVLYLSSILSCIYI